MEALENLLEQLQTQPRESSDIFRQIEVLRKDNTVSEEDIKTSLRQLLARNKLSSAIVDDVLVFLHSLTDKKQTSSNDATIISPPAKNQQNDSITSPIASNDKTRFAPDVQMNDATVLADVHVANDAKTQYAPVDSDATELSENVQSSNDKTHLASAPEDATRLASTGRNDNDHTRLATGPQTYAKANDDATVLSDHAGTENLAETELGTNIDQTSPYGDKPSGPRKITTGSVIKDRFILKEVIGAGGMSVVYKALDLRKHEAKNRNPYVAIKVLGDIFKNQMQSLLVLERESQQIQKLAHPNIVTVYDFDRDGEVIYMTMECLSGKSLDQIISQNKQGMPYEKAVKYVEGMCRGLAYAHSKNIIHSDFKPENVFYTKEHVVKILDFGIARAKQRPGTEMSDEFDAGSLGALTPPYASCEMFDNMDPDPRDDIYALGCVTYKLLSGVHPFDGLPANKARDKKLKPKRLNNLSKRQWRTLEASLAFERNARIPTVADFLNGFLPRTRSPWFYATTIAIGLAIGVGAYSWFAVSTQPEIPQVNLTDEQKETIKTALNTADIYMAIGQLAAPPGDSALDLYNQVLKIDPTNLTAINGKKTIASKYYDMANKQYKDKDYDQSLRLINDALIIEPDDKDLQDLRQKVMQARSKQ